MVGTHAVRKIWVSSCGTATMMMALFKTLMIAASVHTKQGLSFHMGALQILLENPQRFVDDDDAERLNHRLRHVKLMNDSRKY